MKKLAALTLALSVILSLAACGGQQSTTTQSGGATSTGNTQNTNKGGIISALEEIVQPEKELTTFEKLFANGPILAQGQNELWGYIDSTGAWIFDPQLSEGYNDFREGLALVKDPNTQLWGFIDEKGEWVVEPTYKELYEFSEGLANAQDAETEKWGFIDKKGKWAIEPKYESASAFHDGLAAVLPFEDDLQDAEVHQSGYIDKDGKLKIPYQFGWARLFDKGRAIANLPPYYDDCLIDKEGNSLGVLPYGYQPFKVSIVQIGGGSYAEWSYNWMILANREFAEKVSVDSMQGGDWSSGYSWGNTENFNSLLVDKNLNIVFDGYEHNCNILRVLNDRGDMYVIDKATGKYGLMNISGEWIIEPDCNSLLVFTDEIYLSRDDDILPSGGYNSHRIEMEGIGGDNPPAKPFTTDEERAVMLYEKITQVDGVEKHGFTDQNGDTLVDCIYDAVGSIDPNDGTCFGAQIDGLWGIADRSGNWLIQPMFLYIKGMMPNGYFPKAQ